MTDPRTSSRLVHVVDDDDSVRRSLDFLLVTMGYRVERWPSGDAFLKGVDRTVPGCVLLDIRMPGLDGMEVQARMAESGLDFPVIMLTGHGDIALAVRAMKAGAVDFMVKPPDREKLLQAIARAFERLGDRAASRAQAGLAQIQIGKLTQRERQVLEGLACGYPNKTIAYDLGISSRTVEVYRANVMAKLGVNNFADALRVAFAAGLGSESSWCTMRAASTAGSDQDGVEDENTG